MAEIVWQKVFASVYSCDSVNSSSSLLEDQHCRYNITFPVVRCSLPGLDAIDISGEGHLDIRHDIFKKTIDFHGNVIEVRQEGIGAPKIGKPLQRHGGRLKHNETYCGSCYGAETSDDDCCNSCEEVREAYRKRGWGLINADLIDQFSVMEHYKNSEIGYSRVPPGVFFFYDLSRIQLVQKFCTRNTELPLDGGSCGVNGYLILKRFSEFYNYPLNHISQTDDLNFFDSSCDDKDSGDFLYYGRYVLETLKMLAGYLEVVTFGVVSNNEDELEWFSSSDAVEGSGYVLKSEFSHADSTTLQSNLENCEPLGINDICCSINSSSLKNTSVRCKDGFLHMKQDKHDTLGRSLVCLL